MEKRKEVYEHIPIVLSLNENKEDIKVSYIIKTVIKNGDIVGLLILLQDGNLENNDLKVLELLNKFLDKYLE